MNKLSDGFENMNKKTKMVLSLVGISAVVVPAVILLLISSVSKKEPIAPSGARTVDVDNVAKTAKTTKTMPTPVVAATATPKASTSSARPMESNSSSR